MAYAQPSRRQPKGNAGGDVQVRVSGRDELGILPIAAAAVPSVSQILSKIAVGVISIVDPGKKRDAVREGQAEMWFQYASLGSLTAARTLHGGTHFPYTIKEKGYYSDRWARFQSANGGLAAQALAAGDLSPVDTGNSTTPVQIPAALQQTVQDEINAYQTAHAAAGTTPPAAPAIRLTEAGIGAFSLNNPLILGAALVAAVVMHIRKPRR